MVATTAWTETLVEKWKQSDAKMCIWRTSFAYIKEGKKYTILICKGYVFEIHFVWYLGTINLSKFNHPNKSWDLQNCEKYYLLTFSIIACSS